MGIDPFVYFEFKNALDQLELAKINAERELIGLPPLMPLSESLSCRKCYRHSRMSFVIHAYGCRSHHSHG